MTKITSSKFTIVKVFSLGKNFGIPLNFPFRHVCSKPKFTKDYNNDDTINEDWRGPLDKPDPNKRKVLDEVKGKWNKKDVFHNSKIDVLA